MEKRFSLLLHKYSYVYLVISNYKIKGSLEKISKIWKGQVWRRTERGGGVGVGKESQLGSDSSRLLRAEWQTCMSLSLTAFNMMPFVNLLAHTMSQ